MHIHIYVCQNKFSTLNVKHLRGENNINNITPYAFCLWSTFSDHDLFNKGLWAYHPNLVKVHVAFDWTIPIKSGHNFAHVTTAGLSWHVQSSDPMCLLRSLKALSIVIKFQLRAYNPLRRGSQNPRPLSSLVLFVPVLKSIPLRLQIQILDGFLWDRTTQRVRQQQYGTTQNQVKQLNRK